MPLLPIINDAPWMDRAACGDTRGERDDLFFPDNHAPRETQSYCDWCPVQQNCLDFALDPVNEVDSGVWGGVQFTPRLRRQIDEQLGEHTGELVDPAA